MISYNFFAMSFIKTLLARGTNYVLLLICLEGKQVLVLALLEMLCIQILEKMYWIVLISLVGGITLNNVLHCCKLFPRALWSHPL
jgi:hypothetical protein